MKKYIFLLMLFFGTLSCNVQEEVKLATAECKAMMSSVIKEIESLQDNVCFTKEDLIQFLQTRMQSSNDFEGCDIILHDYEYLTN